LRVLQGSVDLSAPDVLFIGGSQTLAAGKGAVLVDDLRFDTEDFQFVNDFESPGPQSFSVIPNGAAAVAASVLPDPADASGNNHVVQISYGGSIGRDFGPRGGFSYAIWQCELFGIDARSFRSLCFRIRGEQGGETPNFYLSDGVRRICLRAKETKPITKAWQEIELPLSFFGDRGLDLSHLQALQLTFEWDKQSGTVYVDDLHFIGQREDDEGKRK
jgi:hypothetical protein